VIQRRQEPTPLVEEHLEPWPGAARDIPDDDGPAADPGSPFAETTAAANREASLDAVDTSRLRLRAAFSWLVVAALVCGAVYAGLYLVDHRVRQQEDLYIGTATLQVTPVGIPAPGDGQVLRVLVRPSQRVARGAPLAVVRVFGTDANGLPTTSSAGIAAPVTGVVSDIVAPAGSAVQAGGPIVEMYQPRSAAFEATVEPDVLARLSRGMHASLTSPGLPGSIAAVVDRVVPAETTAAATDGETQPQTQPTLLLRPVAGAAPRRLVPGLQFDATVDTTSGRENAPRLLPLGS